MEDKTNGIFPMECINKDSASFANVLALILVTSLNAIFFPMKHLTKLVTLLLILPLSAKGQTFTDSLGGGLEAHEKIPFKTVSGDVTELNLHLFYPPDYDPNNTYPAIVLFFGGGWNGGSPSHFFTHASYLSSRGMVVICPDYRTKQSHGALPYQCVEDGKAAMRFVRANAKKLGIDPDWIAAGGGSAGGHVATATATLDRFDAGKNLDVSCVPNALVLFNPVYDNGPNGYGYERVKDYWEFFSPMNNIDADHPPAIVFFGDNDNLVPVATAEAYQRSMHEFEIRSELHVFSGEEHGFFNWNRDKSPNKANYVATLIATDAFLSSLGYLDGEERVVEWLAPHR